MVDLVVFLGKLFAKGSDFRIEVFIESVTAFCILSVIAGIAHDRLPVVPDIRIRNLNKPSPFYKFSRELARLNPAANSSFMNTEMFCGLLG